ncbi:hypothetical protein LCGC14_1166120 [marine sediment metagenome]|uniref:DUF86 domain-containing protein n=1 Tax=marine sediment metagenome TaxID=412755 RepID=A0A0F9ME75_9ZZZZ|nr:MAG: hypothetical protein Lokiarch_11530 [Candidatus Lokiarchaeum sp. GC14_75]
MGKEEKKFQLDEKRIKRYNDKFIQFDKILKLLKEWSEEIDVSTFLNETSAERQFAIYHAFQIILEIVGDIAAMLVRDLQLVPKDDYTNVEYLKKKNIITTDLAKYVKDANGLRNRIVHNYNGLDDQLAYKGILNLIKEITNFVVVIKQWLKNNY